MKRIHFSLLIALYFASGILFISGGSLQFSCEKSFAEKNRFPSPLSLVTGKIFKHIPPAVFTAELAHHAWIPDYTREQILPCIGILQTEQQFRIEITSGILAVPRAPPVTTPISHHS